MTVYVNHINNHFFFFIFKSKETHAIPATNTNYYDEAS